MSAALRAKASAEEKAKNPPKEDTTKRVFNPPILGVFIASDEKEYPCVIHSLFDDGYGMKWAEFSRPQKGSDLIGKIPANTVFLVDSKGQPISNLSYAVPWIKPAEEKQPAKPKPAEEKVKPQLKPAKPAEENAKEPPAVTAEIKADIAAKRLYTLLEQEENKIGKPGTFAYYKPALSGHYAKVGGSMEGIPIWISASYLDNYGVHKYLTTKSNGNISYTPVSIVQIEDTDSNRKSMHKTKQQAKREDKKELAKTIEFLEKQTGFIDTQIIEEIQEEKPKRLFAHKGTKKSLKAKSRFAKTVKSELPELLGEEAEEAEEVIEINEEGLTLCPHCSHSLAGGIENYNSCPFCFQNFTQTKKENTMKTLNKNSQNNAAVEEVSEYQDLIERMLKLEKLAEDTQGLLEEVMQVLEERGLVPETEEEYIPEDFTAEEWSEMPEKAKAKILANDPNNPDNQTEEEEEVKPASKPTKSVSSSSSSQKKATGGNGNGNKATNTNYKYTWGKQGKPKVYGYTQGEKVVCLIDGRERMGTFAGYLQGYPGPKSTDAGFDPEFMAVNIGGEQVWLAPKNVQEA